MKTLSEKRTKLIKESGKWFSKSKNKMSVILRIYSEIEKQDKEFINEILEEMFLLDPNGTSTDKFNSVDFSIFIKEKAGELK